MHVKIELCGHLGEFLCQYLHVKLMLNCVNVSAPSRIKQWADSGEAMTLYHFVKFLGSTSAEVSVFYRRMLQQVL